LTVDDLIAFLRAQLDEDERVARAIEGDRYGDNDDGRWKHWRIEQEADREWLYLRGLGMELAHSYADNVITPQRGEHIARWDPARVLAEVEAKRERIDWIEGELRDDADNETAQWLAKIEARPYAGWPGWREEWSA
jgi:hypothetical protein